MDQEARRKYLIDHLLREYPAHERPAFPSDAQGQRRLLRALMNLRPPQPIDGEVLSVQDDYLQTLRSEKRITCLADLRPTREGLYLWRGDITTLQCGAIVNAANSGLTGCYQPCHTCIDNCIHTYAGMQLRLTCAELMARQGHEEPVGQAKLTPAYNLPCEHVIHTVGPLVRGPLTERHRAQLCSCYRACLDLAEAHHIPSIAFCCISTGVFGFPGEAAAELAVRTVRAWRQETGSAMSIIFNVFTERDEALYRRLLTAAKP